jgi:hypothetical protein
MPNRRTLGELAQRPALPSSPPIYPIPYAPVDEAAFRDWYDAMAALYGLSPDPDAADQFYDYRAAFAAGARPDAMRHWPSTFKRPGHPNEIVAGFNTRTGERVPGTRQGTVQELIDLGWDPEFARTHGRR